MRPMSRIIHMLLRDTLGVCQDTLSSSRLGSIYYEAKNVWQLCRLRQRNTVHYVHNDDIKMSKSAATGVNCAFNEEISLRWHDTIFIFLLGK